MKIKYRPKVVHIAQAAEVMEKRKQTKDETWKFLIEYGLIDGNSFAARNYSGVDGIWKDQPAYVIGSGPPLKDFIDSMGWEFLRGKHTIGINHLIEEWDGFEWFFFLDKRFLTLTTYNLNNFNGTIFAQCTTGLPAKPNTKIFYCNPKGPQAKFSDGLYSSNLSGLAALNLAIMSGANPIYLIGFGTNNDSTAESYHYTPNYNGETKTEKAFNKYLRVMEYFKQFAPWANKIIHVSDGKNIPWFKRKSIKDFKGQHDRAEALDSCKIAKVVHFSFSNDISQHADITRTIINEARGNHFLLSQTEEIPQADLYILEHFLSTDKFVNSFPYPEKAINIVHTVNCIPKKPFRYNIALTKSWKAVLKKYNIPNVRMIYGGIDLSGYENIQPTERPVFGRITRWSPGKVHPEWADITKAILDTVQDSACIIYTQLDQTKQRPPLVDARIKYDSSCNISNFKGAFLKTLSVYYHTNAYFKETLSFGVIEALATGLPVVYLDEGTGVLQEVTGPAGIECKNMQQVKDAIIYLLNSPEERKRYIPIAKEQAKKFDKKIMLAEFDKIIKECIK